jgi:transposase InsO family protein
VLAHPGSRILTRLSKATKGTPSLTREPLLPCEGCLHGKMTKRSYRPSPQRKANPLDLIHMDLVELPVLSIGSFKYMLSIIDDHSSYGRDFYLKEKSDTLEKFQQYITWAERQFNTKLKAIRSDHGGEFTSKDFDEFLSKLGIERQLSAPYEHEQNGRAERWQRTIEEKANSMLQTSGLSPGFWIFAYQYAVYLYNRTPTKVQGWKTPYEKITGITPDLSHIRVFGCRAYIHVPKERRQLGKLGAKAQDLIFVGYIDGQKAYCLWDPSTHTVLNSSDCQFDETVFPKKAPKQTNSNANVPSSSSSGENPEEPDFYPEESDSDPEPSNGIDPPEDDPPSPSPPPMPRRGGDSYFEQPPKPSSSKQRVHFEEPQPQQSPTIDNQGHREEPLHDYIQRPQRVFDRQSGLWQFQTCAAGNNNTLFDPRAPEIPSQPRRSSRPHREVPHPPGSIYEGQSRTQIERNTNADGSTSNCRFPAPTVEEADDDIETSSIEFSFDDQYANHLDNENSLFEIFIQDISTTAEAKTPSKDPQSYKDAVSRPDKAQWLKAMQSEMQSHADNGTWEIVDPKGKNIRNILGNRWVLVKKRDGRYKGRLVVQGFGQKHGIDYDETFSPVVRYETVRFILAKVCVEDWDLKSMDVSTAFLNGELNQEIYMKQPEGFIVKGKEHCITGNFLTYFSTK